MKILFPHRNTAAGTLKLQLEDARAGDYEALPDKYFISMSTVRETFEEKTGDLRMADVSLKVADGTRKFRDSILLNPPVKFKIMLEGKERVYLSPMALDLDGSTEYLSRGDTDFNMNGPEEITNTGFETNTAGWTLNTTSARNNTQAHSGSWSLRDTGSGTPNHNEYVFGSDRMFQVTGEVWIWINATPPGGNATLQLLDASNNVLASRNANNGTVGAWQKLVINLDATLVRKIRLVNTTTVAVYWDDVSLTRAWDFTIAMWFKSVSPGNPSIIVSTGAATSGTVAGVEMLVRTGTEKLEVNICDGVNSATPGQPTTDIVNSAFHFLVLTVDRDGNARAYADTVAGTTASMTNVGNIDSTSALSLGSRLGTYYAGGLLGEVMIIKGWAADTVTIADWYANGIRMRSDTIGFWRWQHPTAIGMDYSGKNKTIMPQNLDSNDIVRDEPRGSFEPYKQRAQVNESLFYGIVDQDTIKQAEKYNRVEMSCFSPLRYLSTKSIDDLWLWLQANGHEETRILQSSARGRYPGGKAVRFSSILEGLTRFMGLTTYSVDSTWLFHSEVVGYAHRELSELWFLTRDKPDQVGIVHNMFDSDTGRSPLSFYRFQNCLELLKHLQLSLFGYAFVVHDPDSDRTTLAFKQRGTSTSAVVVNGVLKDMDITYVTLDGVRVVNEYPGAQVLPGFIYQRETTNGAVNEFTNAFTHTMLLRSIEGYDGSSGAMFLTDYAYLFIQATNPSTPDDLLSVDRVVCPSWPLFGYEGPLQRVLGTAYWSANGGRRAVYTRRHKGVTGLKDGTSSIENLRVMGINAFDYRGMSLQADISAVELDVFKNQCIVTGRKRV